MIQNVLPHLQDIPESSHVLFAPSPFLWIINLSSSKIYSVTSSHRVCLDWSKAEVVLQFFHWLGLFSFFPNNNWQRHLSRLFVISHTNAQVSCLLDKTLLILSCQKLWISQKGKITSTGMHLLCLMEKVTAIIWCCNSLNFEKLQLRRSVIVVIDGFLYYACSHTIYIHKRQTFAPPSNINKSKDVQIVGSYF